MSHCDPLQKLFQTFGMPFLFERFASFGCERLQDVISLKKDEFKRLIGNPDDRTKFVRYLYEVQDLKESCKSREIIAVGDWSIHGQAKGGRNGTFLCLDAQICQKDCPQAKFQPIRFLIDSGSDVVTLRSDVINQLNLEPIGIVKQMGAKGVVLDTRLYSACVRIGRKTLKVEVVSDTIDSLGTCVLQHFDHSIHNDKHFWLEKTH